jgi:hypothetical protein
LGLSAQRLLRFLDLAWSAPVLGLAVSELDPDQADRGLAMLVWLMEQLWLKSYAKKRSLPVVELRIVLALAPLPCGITG